ncbi:hypothetical protein SAMN05660903_03692 [Salegentibacter salinarum]|nr:hypothetical protein SAMN05660903_03692 [Salegentibacter salinarum]
MSLIYLLFFAILNFLIFVFLAKKVKLNTKVRTILFSLLLLLLVFHFLVFSNRGVSGSHFLHLLIASAILIVLHYLAILPILALIRINKKNASHIALKGFNYIRFYMIYILIYLYQCMSILSDSAREHFNSIDIII